MSRPFTLHFTSVFDSAPLQRWLAYKPPVAAVTRDQPSPRPSAPCSQCGTFDTPEWRYGPLGPRTLCNKYEPGDGGASDGRRCGLRYRREMARVETMRQRMSIASLLE